MVKKSIWSNTGMSWYFSWPAGSREYFDAHFVYLHRFLNFGYFYQRYGTRSTLINLYFFIWEIFPIKRHLLSKVASCSSVYIFFLGKPFSHYRFERYKIKSAVESLAKKIIYLSYLNDPDSPNEDFCVFSGSWTRFDPWNRKTDKKSKSFSSLKWTISNNRSKTLKSNDRKNDFALFGI